MEIIVPGHYTERDKEVAAAKRSEFKRNPYTTGSAHLDDMIALNKALILCDTHKRKFNAKAAKYRIHPAENLKRVRGNCDVCKQFVLATLFLNERDWNDENVKLEKWKRGLEYAHFVKH